MAVVVNDVWVRKSLDFLHSFWRVWVSYLNGVYPVFSVFQTLLRKHQFWWKVSWKHLKRWQEKQLSSQKSSQRTRSVGPKISLPSFKQPTIWVHKPLRQRWYFCSTFRCIEINCRCYGISSVLVNTFLGSLSSDVFEWLTEIDLLLCWAVILNKCLGKSSL